MTTVTLVQDVYRSWKQQACVDCGEEATVGRLAGPSGGRRCEQCYQNRHACEVCGVYISGYGTSGKCARHAERREPAKREPAPRVKKTMPCGKCGKPIAGGATGLCISCVPRKPRIRCVSCSRRVKVEEPRYSLAFHGRYKARDRGERRAVLCQRCGESWEKALEQLKQRTKSAGAK